MLLRGLVTLCQPRIGNGLLRDPVRICCCRPPVFSCIFFFAGSNRSALLLVQINYARCSRLLRVVPGNRGCAAMVRCCCIHGAGRFCITYCVVARSQQKYKASACHCGQEARENGCAQSDHRTFPFRRQQFLHLFPSFISRPEAALLQFHAHELIEQGIVVLHDAMVLMRKYFTTSCFSCARAKLTCHLEVPSEISSRAAISLWL